jgi:type II restriction enzyme
VQIALPSGGLEAYTSKAQRARIATEAWASLNLYCPNCNSPALTPSLANTPAVDFNCPKCAATYQLKAQSSAFSRRIVDAAYSTMVRAILEDRTPNLFAMHYEISDWVVKNVILIPRFAFPLSAIEKRKPLAETARRAGWIGCNILLHAIPPDARIQIISEGKPVEAAKVRGQYARIRPLEKLDAKQRGWTLDVLTLSARSGKKNSTWPKCISQKKSSRSYTLLIATSARKSVSNSKSSATSASSSFWAEAITASADIS